MLSYPDLTPYPSEIDAMLGLQPLAVGWLSRRQTFPVGAPDPDFVKKLAGFCRPEVRAFPFRPPLRCALENHQVEPFEIDGRTVELGRSEIRVLGDDDIFAAPDLILHYVTAHQYRPPAEFVTAVLRGPSPNSPEFRALIRSLHAL